ncbi:hypothetical protein SK128_007960, partial [Halocaridina rubra]
LRITKSRAAEQPIALRFRVCNESRTSNLTQINRIDWGFHVVKQLLIVLTNLVHIHTDKQEWSEE